MHKCLQDALTLTSRFSKPDLFITMTANPKWIEIQDQLPAGFSPQSCPDMVSSPKGSLFTCIFHSLHELLQTI